MYYAVFEKKKIIRVVAIVVAFAVLIPLLKVTSAVEVVSGKANKKLPIYYVVTEKKQVAISFDCAWGTDYTDKLLKIMEDNGVKSTFFAVEFWVDKNPEYVKKISEQGHEIGTHSATHPYMSKLSKDNVIKELTTSVEKIENVIGKKVKLFRPPYGDYDNQLIETAKERGLYTIQWDVDSLDWKNLTKSEITERVLKRVKNGSIVLFHNQGLHTAEALPDVIKALKERGYEFKRISEMIYTDGYEMQVDGGQKKIETS